MPLSVRLFLTGVHFIGGVVSLSAAEISTADVQTRLDLSTIRQEIRRYLESLHLPGQPYGHYKDPKATEPLLYPSCDVAITRAVMGEDLRKTLSPQQRREWIEHINSFAQPDGTYRTGQAGGTSKHANGMVIGALGVLGGRQRYPVRFYEEFDTPEKVAAWLERIDWHVQWSGSLLFWGGMHCFSVSRRCTDEWRQGVFNWLNANLDPQSGWWRKGVPHKRPGIDGLGGGAHIWPLYQHHAQKFPLPERLLDSILALQKPDGTWHISGGYLDLDALYGLAFMKAQAPTYRGADIRAAALRNGAQLRRVFARYLAKAPDAHAVLARAGAFGLLQQLLPDVFHDTVQWTDIFSDPRFYQTAAVEVLGSN